MMGRTQKVCQVCGKPFYGGTDCHYCPDCAKLKKSDTAVRIRTCKDCGVDFFGGPRAKRCPNCAHIARKETQRQYKKRGAMRPIGSIDKCRICNAEYAVVSGRQKYCSDECQRKGVLEWQRAHKKGYHRASGQDIKKMQRRSQVQKVCMYCLRPFTSNTPTNVCSDYCRTEQKKLQQCISDIKRGYNRDLRKYEEKREKYREVSKNE